MRLEERIEQIRQDIGSERYTTAAKESAAVIEFAFREIFRRSIGAVDGKARSKAFEAEKKIGGPSKDADNFTLGELVQLFRESKLFQAYSEATGTQLRAITMIDFNQVVATRNRMQHDFYEVSRGEAQLFLHCVENMLEAFGILTLDAPHAEQHAPPDTETRSTRSASSRDSAQRRPSTYSPRGEREGTRLQEQASLHRPIDMRMFEYALARSGKRLLGLDLGCARGDVTVDRFGSFDAFEKVIGVDKDEECIEKACAAHGDDSRFSFELVDIEGPTAQDELARLITQEGEYDGVVVLGVAVLLHLAAPIRLLKNLRSVIPRGSQVIIRGTDDGTTVGYPDLEERLAFILEMTRNAPGQSERQNGRKFFQQLTRAGFRDIQMFVEPFLLPNLSEDERSLLWPASFAWRLRSWEIAEAAGSLNQHDRESVVMLRSALEEFELDLDDPGFFFCEYLYGAVGHT